MQIETVTLAYAQKALGGPELVDGLVHIKALPWLSVVQAVEGEYSIQLDDRPTERTGKRGMFVAPSQAMQRIGHHADPLSGRLRVRWVFLDVRLNGQYRLEDLYDLPTVVPEPVRTELDQVLEALFGTDDLCDTMSLMYQVVKCLLRVGTPKATLLSPAMMAVTAYIREHCAEPLTVAQIAAQVPMSTSHLHALFRQALNTSPIAYLNHTRLTRAADLLKQTDLTVEKVAQQAGFADAAYFCRCFKRTFQVTPTQYRHRG